MKNNQRAKKYLKFRVNLRQQQQISFQKSFQNEFKNIFLQNFWVEVFL